MKKRRGDQTALTRSLGAQVRDYLLVQGQRRRLFPRALLVGLLAGGTAVAFRWALEEGDASAVGSLPGRSMHRSGGGSCLPLSARSAPGSQSSWCTASRPKRRGAASPISKPSSIGSVPCAGRPLCR